MIDHSKINNKCKIKNISNKTHLYSYVCQNFLNNIVKMLCIYVYLFWLNCVFIILTLRIFLVTVLYYLWFSWYVILLHALMLDLELYLCNPRNLGTLYDCKVEDMYESMRISHIKYYLMRPLVMWLKINHYIIRIYIVFKVEVNHESMRYSHIKCYPIRPKDYFDYLSLL